MSKFYWVAILPALVAVVCVVMAWYIVHRSNQEVVPPSPHLQSPLPPCSIPPPPEVHPTSVHPTSVHPTSVHPTSFTLPSDQLRVPHPPARDMVCVDVGADLKREKRIWRLNLSSECRDNEVWPTPSEWRMDLPTHVRNISSVALRSVAMHASEYTVDVWNQSIDLLFGGTTYAVTVPVGEHTSGASLAGAVQAAIIATDAALLAFTVSYTALTDTITISEGTPGEFTLLWRSGTNANTSMWKTLGYELRDTTSVLVGGTHDAVAPGRVDLMGVLAIDLFADELEHSVDGPIGRIQLQRTVAGDTPVYQRYNYITEAHTFWPISRLTFLTLRFMVERVRVNQDGTTMCDRRPYMFNGRNNTVRLDFGCTEYVNPLEEDVQLDPGT
jgi:hypothetical protein